MGWLEKPLAISRERGKLAITWSKMMPREFPKWFLRRLLFIRIAKGDAEQVREVIGWGADPNWVTKKRRPAIVKSVRGFSVDAETIKVLLDNGADPHATDEMGCTALDHAKRRLAKYDGRPRRPIRRSPSLTAGGELNLQEHEWEFINEMETKHPGFEDDYLESRRKAAEKVFDNRGNLQRAVPLLEAAMKMRPKG